MFLWDITKDDLYISFKEYVENKFKHNIEIEYRKSYIGFGKFCSFYLFWIKQDNNGIYKITFRKKYSPERENNASTIIFNKENFDIIKAAVDNIFIEYNNKRSLTYNTEQNYEEKYISCLNELEKALKSLSQHLEKNEVPTFFYQYNLMSNRLYNALNRAKISNFKDLSLLSAQKISNIKNLGYKSFLELIDVIGAFIKKGRDIVVSVKEEPKKNLTNDFSNKQTNLRTPKVICSTNNPCSFKHSEDTILNYLQDTSIFNENKKDEYLHLTIDLLDKFSNAAFFILKNRELEIFAFILEKKEDITLQAIGENFNLSRERIRQIIAKISRKLKSYTKREKNSNLVEIVEKLNSYETRDFCEFIINGLYVNSSNKIMELFLSCFYSQQTVKKILFMCKLLIQKMQKTACKKINKYSDFIYKNVTYPSLCVGNKPLVSLLEEPKKPLAYQYLKKANDVLLKATGVKKVVYNPNLIYAQHGKALYKPDFAVELIDGNIVLVVVLKTINLAFYYNLERFNKLHLYCKEKKLGYIIIDERCRNIREFKEKYIPEKIERYLNNILEKREIIFWNDIKPIKVEKNTKTKLIVSYVIKNKLKFSLHPFAITKNR